MDHAVTALQDQQFLYHNIPEKVSSIISQITGIEVQLNQKESNIVLLDQTPNTIVMAIRAIGDFDGVFLLRLYSDLAKLLTGRILKISEEMVTDDDLFDLTGELLNMIVGKIKHLLAQREVYMSHFTPPERVISEIEFHLMERLYIPFIGPRSGFQLEILYNE